MSTDRGDGGSSDVLTARQRKDAVTLPVDPSDEELARDWTLSKADMREVKRCRGMDNRRRFAIQLCVFRKHGRFLMDYGSVRGRILTHIHQQLGIPNGEMFLSITVREATEIEHQQRIREYLGWRSFDSAANERLEAWVVARVVEGVAPRELPRRAEDLLRSWKVVLPAPSTLDRLIASATTRAEEEVYERITAVLPPKLQEAFDALLDVPEGDTRSGLFRLKAYPPKANATAAATQIERFRTLESLGVGAIDLSGVGAALVEHLAEKTRRYSVRELKRFEPAKRRAMVACFLVEAHKTILDHIVEMHDEVMTLACRKARNGFERQHRDFRRRAKEGVETLLQAVEILLDVERPRDLVLQELYAEVGEPALRIAQESCRTFMRMEERGYIDELVSRYTNLRRYLPAFFRLPLKGEPGTRQILDAIALLAKLDDGEIKELPDGAVRSFVPAAWRSILEREDGALDRRVWEVSLALAVRDALRSGDLYLPDSRRHVSFPNLLYPEPLWAETREHAYAELALPSEADEVLARLRQELDEAARRADQGLPANPFVSVEGESLKLKRDDALEVPESVKELKRVLQTSLPKVRIEDLLAEVDSWCGFTRQFRPLTGHERRPENHYATLLAAVVAHGTNLGIAAMGASADGVTVEMLHHVTHWYLRDETLRAANAELVNYHHRLPLSSVWGGGTVSSSDGQRFGIRKGTLFGSVYPRHFGYYQPAVSLYTHVSDQHSVFSTQVISCFPREALYVLDGLLENVTVLCPREHTTDTHGYTEHLFGLCYLLGFTFMPRIKDLADQQLYKPDRAVSYGRLDPLFRGAVDLDLIREQWDPLVRVAASLHHRTAPAHVVMQRLANSSPADRLAKALTALGRLVKTLHILRYIHEEDFRRKVQLQLNRGESRHELARWLFFADRGEFRVGDYVEVMNKASCLSLLSNAVLVWNTVRIGEIVEQMKTAGQDVPVADLAKISPLLREHVFANGRYCFRQAIPGVDLS